MVKLKSLHLENYCGFRDTFFNFADEAGNPKSLVCFFGPNGCGKSSLLEAISLVSSAYRFYKKETDLLFRKRTYSADYNPTWTEYEIEYAKRSNFATEGFKKKILLNLITMRLTAMFETSEGDKEVIITTEGVEKNELSKEQMSYCYFIDADHPMNTQKFQLPLGYEERFLDIANLVYGYDCYLDKQVNDIDESGETYYLDFVVRKPEGTKVHYKSMSGGEKKLATLLRYLCNPLYIDDFDMLVIDNIVKEVYMSRHAPMIDKFREIFPDKQFFIATHSPILVGLQDEKRGIFIPPYLEKNSLYPIAEIKVKSLSSTMSES